MINITSQTKLTKQKHAVLIIYPKENEAHARSLEEIHPLNGY